MSAIVRRFEHSLALPFFGIGMKTDLFQSCGHCRVFQSCWHIEGSTFTASSFRIWNSSTGIPSPPRQAPGGADPAAAQIKQGNEGGQGAVADRGQAQAGAKRRDAPEHCPERQAFAA